MAYHCKNCNQRVYPDMEGNGHPPDFCSKKCKREYNS